MIDPLYNDDRRYPETTEVRFMNRRGLIRIETGKDPKGSMSYPARWSTEDYAIQKTDSNRYVLVYTPRFRAEWHRVPDEIHDELVDLLIEKDDEMLTLWCEEFVRKVVAENCKDPERFDAMVERIIEFGEKKGKTSAQHSIRRALGI